MTANPGRRFLIDSTANGGPVGTAEDVARFLQAPAGGHIDGHRIIPRSRTLC